MKIETTQIIGDGDDRKEGPNETQTREPTRTAAAETSASNQQLAESPLDTLRTNSVQLTVAPTQVLGYSGSITSDRHVPTSISPEDQDLLLGEIGHDVRAKEIGVAFSQFEQCFGINIPDASERNVENLRKDLGPLSPEEAIFLKTFESLPLTLKHASPALQNVLDSGAILSLQERGRLGEDIRNQRVGTGGGLDDFVYFVIGFGDHSVPDYLSGENGDVVVVPVTLDLLCDGLWVGPHLSLYGRQGKLCPMQFGDTVRTVHHNTRFDQDTGTVSLEKTYCYKSGDGRTITQTVGFADEVFTGRDLLPGLGMKLLQELRLIGGSYQDIVLRRANETDAVGRLLNIHFDSWDFPEAKVPTRLTLDRHDVEFVEGRPHALIPEFYDSLRKNDVIRLKQLLEAGAPIEAPFQGQPSPLFFAASQKANEAVLFLLEHGARITTNWRNPFSDMTIMNIVAIHCRPDVVDAALRRGGDDEPVIPKVRRLIDVSDGQLLHDLYRKNQTQGVEYVRASNKVFDGIAINSAIEHGRIDHAIQYLEQGAPASWMLYGYSALMQLARIPKLQAPVQQDLLNLASKLIDGGCPVDVLYFDGLGFRKGENREGWTALFFAVEAGNLELVDLLLRKGADVNLESKYGQTVLDMALNLSTLKEEGKHSAIIARLRENGAVRKIGLEPEEEIYSDNRLTVAAMIVGENENGEVSVVLGRNQDHKTRQLKPAVFPGGQVDLTDSSSVFAAQREVFEETRLDLRGRDSVLLHRHKDLGGKIKRLEKQQGAYYRHDTHLFTDVPLGKVPLRPSDDFVELDIVPLSHIQEEKDDHGEISYFYMRGQTKIPIQYSNGLLIEAYKTGGETIAQEQSRRISKALQLEHRGTELLCKEITNRHRKNREKLNTLLSSVNLIEVANVHCDCEFGRTLHSVTPMAAAASVGDEQTIRDLISRGVSPDGLGGPRGGAVYYTVFSKASNRESVLELLLHEGADPDGHSANERDLYGEFTPLMFALQRGETDMANMLIQAGANVDYIATKEHSSPLILAVRNNDFGMVRKLVSLGARIDISFNNSSIVENLALKHVSAIDEASKLGFKQMARFLEVLNGNRPPFA